MSFLDRFRRPDKAEPPPTLTAEQLDSLPHDGAARAIREITGTLQIGQIVSVQAGDIVAWGRVEVEEPIVAAFAATVGYGAGEGQAYTFLNLELAGNRAHWLALEGEGHNRLARAYLFRCYDHHQLRQDLAWCLGQYLGCEYPQAPYLLEVGGDFDDGQQKVWTAYSARHGTLRTALGISKLFPNLGPNTEVEYQDMTLAVGEDPDAAPFHCRYLALGDYALALVGERLPLRALEVYPHG